MPPSTKKILVFLCLTFALSSIFYYLIISSQSVAGYSMGLMWCPGIAALLTQLIFQRSIRSLGWSFKPFKYLLAGYALPFAYGLIVYGLVWLSGIGVFSPQALTEQAAIQLPFQVSSPYLFVVIYAVIVGTIGLVSSSVSALGEEIGWRGLLVPELAKRFSFTATALISGGIWAVWHMPLILFADYKNSGAPLGWSLVCFVLMVMGISFSFAWLRLKSGSLWSAVILHASHNLFIQALFTPLTGRTNLSPYIIDEFGLGLALAGLVVAYLFWRKRGELPAGSSA